MSKNDGEAHSHNPMRRVLGNFWLLIRGRGIAAVMALGATALMARVLGPVEFGMVVLIQAYTQLIAGLLNFRPFEAVVRYGVPLHDSGDTHTLHRLIRVCRRVDLSASLTSTFIALLAAPFIGPMMGMDSRHVMILTVYSLVLFTASNGTATGVLRLLGLFDAMGRQMMVGPAIRFFGAVIAWYLHGSIEMVVVILAIAFASENLYLNWLGRREYRLHVGHPLPSDHAKKARMSEFTGLRNFLWIAYWQSNLDMVPKHGTTILTGYLLGPSQAGLLRLARELASPLAKLATLIRQVVYPDLTRSWHQGSNDFKHVAYRTAMLGGAVGVLLVAIGFFLGDLLLSFLVGKAFVAAAPVLTLMLLAATFDLSASPLRSATYAIGDASKALHLYVLSTIIYLVLFVVLTSKFGLIGAGVASCVAAVIPLLGLFILIRNTKL